MSAYQEFIKSKLHFVSPSGLAKIPDLHPHLFDYQKKSVEFSLRNGRGALFLDTGLGKTLCQLEWAKHVPGKVLILAPLAVAEQTKREGETIGLEVHHSRDGKAPGKVTITNYERAHLFNIGEFSAVVLDESSILKAFMGKTKQWLCDSFRKTSFRLCCTATPAPNDYMELGNHSEFLGVMPGNEMLSRFFINDTMHFGHYRLKGHAVKPFWEWVAAWAVCAGKPSDIGGDDSRHTLPPLKTNLHFVECDQKSTDGETLFRLPALSATEIRTEKRASIEQRVEKAVSLASGKDFVICWCETNDESAALAKAFGDDCVEVVGSDSVDKKEQMLDAFSRGQVRVIVTKPSIAGFGLNWQHCNHAIFCSVSYSYEMHYQAVRRTWRFGQKRPVTVDVVMATTERPIWQAVERKMRDHETMKEQMQYAFRSLGIQRQIKLPYNPQHTGHLPLWLFTNR